MEGVAEGPLPDTFQNDSELLLLSIEDWQKTTTPPKSYSPKSKINPARLERNHGKDTQAFNSECQRRGLTPGYRFNEIAKGCFDVTLLVDGIFFGKAGPYASLRDAKEAVCRQALSTINTLGHKEVPSKKGNSSDLNSLSSDVVLPDGIDEENWVALVNGYAQMNKIDYPDYDFCDGPPWTCTLSFADTTLVSSPFETPYGPFPRKDTAKKAVAMEAVKWLRAHDKFSSRPSRDTSSPRPGRSLKLSREASSSSAASGEPSTTKTSYAARVFQLTRELGFMQPRFEVVRGAGNFVDESATFAEADVRYEPRLAGVHAQASRLFGKKVAHEECCRLLLEVLDEIRRSRLSQTG